MLTHVHAHQRGRLTRQLAVGHAACRNTTTPCGGTKERVVGRGAEVGLHSVKLEVEHGDVRARVQRGAILTRAGRMGVERSPPPLEARSGRVADGCRDLQWERVAAAGEPREEVDAVAIRIRDNIRREPAAFVGDHITVAEEAVCGVGVRRNAVHTRHRNSRQPEGRA